MQDEHGSKIHPGGELDGFLQESRLETGTGALGH